MSADYRVLISCPLIQGHLQEFEDLFAERGVTYDVVEVDQHLSEEELTDIIADYHGVIAGDDEFTSAVFRAAENLRVISKWGIGTDNIDFEAAEDAGVTVHNTPGAFTDEVSDVVFGYAVMLTRHLHRVDNAVRNGDWFSPRGVSLRGKTLGVVGVGSIGSAVARRAPAHGLNVIGTDVRPLPDKLEAETGIERVGHDELFESADIVSLNCALTEETHHLVGAAELEALGPSGYLINTARGQLVDQEALVDALESETIAGAGLDVYEGEPLPSDHPLTRMENVVLGTHNAQNTEEAVSAVNERAVRNLLDELAE